MASADLPEAVGPRMTMRRAGSAVILILAREFPAEQEDRERDGGED